MFIYSMESLVKLYSSIPLENEPSTVPDARIKFLFTPQRINDGGHTPRALGLTSLPPNGWTVLTGGDNYYCPMFIESLLDVVEIKHDLGFVYWDFVLDRKGNQSPPQSTTDATLQQHQQRNGYLVTIPIVIGDVSHDLSFNEQDDLQQLALRFVEKHGLQEGGGCELGSPDSGTKCVAHKLFLAMQNELERALRGEGPAWKSTLDRYEGYVSASLRQGEIDIGAFAFPTHIGQAVVRMYIRYHLTQSVYMNHETPNPIPPQCFSPIAINQSNNQGYRWNHHSADWTFASHLLEFINASGLEPHHLKRTLYVHN
jgi:hypothetical protein